MRSRIIVALSLVAGVLSACQTTTPEERRAADEARCASYGFRRGTDGFANCLQKIDLDRSAERRAFRYGYDGGPWGWDRPVVVYR
jgi:hypothetical protein